MQVSNLFYYPVKSLAGHSTIQANLDRFGIEGDRRFMVVDSEGKFLTQRKFPRLAKIVPDVSTQYLKLNDVTGESIKIAREAFDKEIAVRVWGDSLVAQRASISELDQWLSQLLENDVHLVYMPDQCDRQVDLAFAAKGEVVSFADGFPLLICNEASLEDLNSRLADPVGMERFRPNIVVSGVGAFAESDWKRIRIGDVELDLVKPCSRCSMTTLDQHGRFNKEPLKTLATYRKNDYGVCFGENALIRKTGALNVGDPVEILE